MATANGLNANSTGIAVYNGSGTWTGVTITAGNAGVTVTNGNGTGGNPTISVNGLGLPNTDVTTATQQLATNNSYTTDRSGGVTYTLPTTATEGDVMVIAGKLGAWTVNYTTSQQILIGSVSSTVTSGTIASTNVGDSIILMCITGGASTVWRAISVVGNISVT
jgi:hypothetical protein